jgi:hypothetical protein
MGRNVYLLIVTDPLIFLKKLPSVCLNVLSGDTLTAVFNICK